MSRKPGRYPSESNEISIFYLTRKGSGQASDSNSIPHAVSESSGMQTSPYPAIGYPYDPTKPDMIPQIQIPEIPFIGPMAQCPIGAPLKAGQCMLPLLQWIRTWFITCWNLCCHSMCLASLHGTEEPLGIFEDCKNIGLVVFVGTRRAPG